MSSVSTSNFNQLDYFTYEVTENSIGKFNGYLKSIVTKNSSVIFNGHTLAAGMIDKVLNRYYQSIEIQGNCIIEVGSYQNNSDIFSINTKDYFNATAKIDAADGIPTALIRVGSNAAFANLLPPNGIGEGDDWREYNTDNYGLIKAQVFSSGSINRLQITKNNTDLAANNAVDYIHWETPLPNIQDVLIDRYKLDHVFSGYMNLTGFLNPVLNRIDLSGNMQNVNFSNPLNVNKWWELAPSLTELRFYNATKFNTTEFNWDTFAQDGLSTGVVRLEFLEDTSIRHNCRSTFALTLADSATMSFAGNTYVNTGNNINNLLVSLQNGTTDNGFFDVQSTGFVNSDLSVDGANAVTALQSRGWTILIDA